MRALSCFVKSFVVLEKASNLSNLICKSILRLIPSKIVTLTFLFGVARSTDALLHRNIRKYHPCQEPLTIYKMGTDMFPGMILWCNATIFFFIDCCPEWRQSIFWYTLIVTFALDMDKQLRCSCLSVDQFSINLTSWLSSQLVHGL